MKWRDQEDPVVRILMYLVFSAPLSCGSFLGLCNLRVFQFLFFLVDLKGNPVFLNLDLISGMKYVYLHRRPPLQHSSFTPVRTSIVLKVVVHVVKI